MFKLIQIHTHGIHIVEGTQIHVLCAWHKIDIHEESFRASYLFNSKGVLDDAKISYRDIIRKGQ
jgi:hypothetical protein